MEEVDGSEREFVEFVEAPHQAVEMAHIHVVGVGPEWVWRLLGPGESARRGFSEVKLAGGPPRVTPCRTDNARAFRVGTENCL
ncbi:hypothetical protein AWC15_05510 [Mycobacterium lacus]|uniref:Uncharacterized protein n=1 Tax=Mycobacterium lacus TaxID=169765 RepID=A0A1X1XWX0_9MYCO|nr:hypothetical protein AWC15_05510 [Mycobacterium lacus]BBX95125.1 hypothetical protein MLAC_04190 [Mycobacterium lacus]